MTQAVAASAIADLIVILNESDELRAARAGYRATVAPVPAMRVDPVVDDAKRQRLGELRDGAKISIVPGPFPGEHRMQRVVDIVTPHRVQTVAAYDWSPDQPGVVEITLGGDH